MPPLALLAGEGGVSTEAAEDGDGACGSSGKPGANMVDPRCFGFARAVLTSPPPAAVAAVLAADASSSKSGERLPEFTSAADTS